MEPVEIEVGKPGPRPGPTRGFVPLVATLLIAAPIGYGILGGFRAIPQYDVRSVVFLARVADSVSALFPRQVDAEMEITRVTALEGVLVYHYRFFNFLAAELDADLVSGLRPSVTRTTCANVVTRDNFLKKDVTLRFTYADRLGSALTSFDVTRLDCGV